MGYYQDLWDEISNDPLGRGYAGIDDKAVADDLNTVYRTRNRTSITGDEAFQATDDTEFGGLTAAKRELWMSFCGRDTIDPFGSANVNFVLWVYGGGSATVNNLLVLRVENVTRATELGFPFVKPGHVKDARLLGV